MSRPAEDNISDGDKSVFDWCVDGQVQQVQERLRAGADVDGKDGQVGVQLVECLYNYAYYFLMLICTSMISWTFTQILRYGYSSSRIFTFLSSFKWS